MMQVAGVSAQILGTSARQQSQGSLKLLMYYQGTQSQNLNFKLTGGGVCSAQSGGATFACNQNGNTEARGSGGAAMFKIIYQPWEGLQYYASFGMGDYSLQIPSAAVVNRLTGDSPGVIGTAGIRAVVYPDTIVTPAIAFDASITRSYYRFNQISSDASGAAVEQRLNLMQYQLALEASHVFMVEGFWKIEPYGGVKWVRVQSDLKDAISGGHAGGQQDETTPFLGIRIPAYENEILFAEASFIGGYQYAGGLELRFK